MHCKIMSPEVYEKTELVYNSSVGDKCQTLVVFYVPQQNPKGAYALSRIQVNRASSPGNRWSGVRELVYMNLTQDR